MSMCQSVSSIWKWDVFPGKLMIRILVQGIVLETYFYTV